MKIIFLDIDGVLNCETAYITGYCKYINTFGKQYQQFYPPSKSLLNRLIEETEAKIVISSTWRHSGLDHMKRVWESEGMSGEIIDITPTIYSNLRNSSYSVSTPRGVEIDYWLKSKKFYQTFWSKEHQLKSMEESGIDNYIIIDDDSDMLYNQKDNFVHVLPSPRNRDGFKEEHYNLAINILSKNFIQLHKDKFCD